MGSSSASLGEFSCSLSAQSCSAGPTLHQHRAHCSSRSQRNRSILQLVMASLLRICEAGSSPCLQTLSVAVVTLNLSFNRSASSCRSIYNHAMYIFGLLRRTWLRRILATSVEFPTGLLLRQSMGIEVMKDLRSSAIEKPVSHSCSYLLFRRL
jgi:hypothetical protein